MSFHVASIKGGNEVWELLSEDGNLAMLVATFTNIEDAQFFADSKNGLRRTHDKNFVFQDCVWEVGPEGFVLVDDQGVADESEYDEETFYSQFETEEVIDLTDDMVYDDPPYWPKDILGLIERRYEYRSRSYVLRSWHTHHPPPCT